LGGGWGRGAEGTVGKNDATENRSRGRGKTYEERNRGKTRSTKKKKNDKEKGHVATTLGPRNLQQL